MNSSRSVMFDVAMLEELRRRFRELPEPKVSEMSKMQLVRELATEIEELQKLGHSTKTIADTFSAAGVLLTNSTLKTYLSKLKASPRKPKRRRWREPEVNALSTLSAPPAAGLDTVETQSPSIPTSDDPTQPSSRGEPLGHASAALGKADAQSSRDRKEDARGAGSVDGGGDAPAMRESIDRRRATFVAREDSRDI